MTNDERDAIQAAGIHLTRFGEPILARDMAEYRRIRLEVQSRDTRTAAQKDEDAICAQGRPLDYPI